VIGLSEDEWWPRWLGRRRRPFFRGWFFEDVDEVFREMEREFSELLKKAPRDYVRERVLPDGSKVQEWGPFVYGYSIKIGPEGKPEIREFGNIRPEAGPGIGKPRIDIKEEREPLVDVITTDGEVKVLAELPGVEKNDVKLHGTEETLTISVDTPQRKYYKEVELPAKVDPQRAKSSYKNGVLEVTLARREAKPKGEPIKVE